LNEFEKNLARRDILNLFKDGVRAADPKLCVANCLSKLIADDPSHFHKTMVIGVGKAACNMMLGALSVLPKNNFINRPIVITNQENLVDINGVTIMVAGHPFPNQESLIATQKALKTATSLTVDDTLLVLVSGGASAMVSQPVEGISLTDKINTTQAMLASGIDINQMNVVRKQLSAVKGGKLAELASPARVIGLILSDVIGDDLGAIASGPTVHSNENRTDAINILKKADVWYNLSKSVIQHLEKPVTPVRSLPNDFFKKDVKNYLIGSNNVSVSAVESAAKKTGLNVKILKEPVCGEAKVAAESLVIIAGGLLGKNSTDTPLLIVAGGETTVTIKGDGKGGRNQEFALAFALAAEHNNLPPRWLFLSAGTDGRDGPTDAAGGFVDPESLIRMRENGTNPIHALDNNDAYHALKSSNDLLITGGTGTNVADLQLLLLY
jgi:hydroxypyruvate reductase|tara:strand:- start:682 stop:1998 length:1317 start_codon:yes stop_codon:yes gene_type:complete